VNLAEIAPKKKEKKLTREGSVPSAAPAEEIQRRSAEVTPHAAPRDHHLAADRARESRRANGGGDLRAELLFFLPPSYVRQRGEGEEGGGGGAKQGTGYGYLPSGNGRRVIEEWVHTVRFAD